MIKICQNLNYALIRLYELDFAFPMVYFGHATVLFMINGNNVLQPENGHTQKMKLFLMLSVLDDFKYYFSVFSLATLFHFIEYRTPAK